MPNYDYRCDACCAEFETFQSIHDEALQDCPHCREPKLQRLISRAGLVFKGSGFYVNDSKAQPKAPPKNTTPEKSPAPQPGKADSAASSTAPNVSDKAKS